MSTLLFFPFFTGVSSRISSLPLRLMTTRSPFLFVTVETLTSCTLPGLVASCRDCSDTREAVPPTWNVRIVSCVPGEVLSAAKDRLGSDDADRFPDLDELAAGE